MSRPMSLCVRRDVVNASEIAAHYAEQGLETVDDMHVTIIYSTSPVDWMKMGASWDSEIKVPEGGPRVHELFGAGFLVLEFTNWSLRYRNEMMREEGAQSNYLDYRPHVTLAKTTDFDEDLAPWTGEILLGPEIFEQVKE